MWEEGAVESPPSGSLHRRWQWGEETPTEGDQRKEMQGSAFPLFSADPLAEWSRSLQHRCEQQNLLCSVSPGEGAPRDSPVPQFLSSPLGLCFCQQTALAWSRWAAKCRFCSCLVWLKPLGAAAHCAGVCDRLLPLCRARGWDEHLS